MRIIALASGRRGSFSWSGSFEVALFGALIGVPVALGFFLARDRLSSRVAWPGMLLGGVLWGLFAVLPPASARSALAATTVPPLVTASLFLGLFVLYGAGLEWYWRKFSWRP